MFDNPIEIAAPIVATVALLLFLRARRSPHARAVLGPAADGWEVVRRGLLPLLDRLARRRLDGGHYASYELGEGEIVGLIDASPEEVERMLWDAGATRMPLAALKRLPGDRTEIGSWAWRDGVLAREQVHVMLFRGVEEGETLVAAHKEPNALNPWTALDHYRGVGYSPEEGEREVRQRLSGVFRES